MRYLLILLLAVMILGTAAQAKLYRWVDEEGNVQYSDKMPPDYIEKPHAELDQRGIAVKQVERAKTPEEIAEEQRLEELRRETQRRLAEQKAKDAVLLKTFQSEDDIILARDGKLALYDTHIRLAYKNIERLKIRLAQQKKKAADLERKGQVIPAKMEKAINNIRQQIKHNYAQILREGENKEKVRQQYNQDLERFRKLKQLEQTKSIESENKQKFNALVRTAIACTDDVDCDAVWKKAKEYARKNATTPVYVDSDQIFITQPPKKPSDLSVTVSRLRAKKDQPEIVFLDVQCKSRTIKEPWCKTPKAQQMREQFRSVVMVKKQAKN